MPLGRRLLALLLVTMGCISTGSLEYTKLYCRNENSMHFVYFQPHLTQIYVMSPEERIKKYFNTYFGWVLRLFSQLRRDEN